LIRRASFLQSVKTEASTQKRAAIYVRVSTDKQTIENQVRELRQIAERRGWQVVEEYSDAGISGAKGRDKRPGLDEMLKDAQRRKFDLVMAWAIAGRDKGLAVVKHHCIYFPGSCAQSSENARLVSRPLLECYPGCYPVLSLRLSSAW
jgi:Resolvase, N terminal domain